ncbi:MAG: GntR family transcriptional regulator [Oscillospiraceae bacterium]
MYSIDVRSRVPIYEQLKQNIVKLISTGILDPDEQLPGVRSLARELGINPNTVQKSYQELEADGFIYQAAGRGSFVAACRDTAIALNEKKLYELYEAICSARKMGITKGEIICKVNEAYSEEAAK